MAHTVRTVFFTASEKEAPELRRSITSLPHMRIVAELDDPSMLAQAVSQFPCDLLIADLDPQAPVVLECLKQLREAYPDLPIFSLSRNTDGNVVLAAMKSGIREYIVKPLNVSELETAVSRVIQLSPRNKEPGKLVSVMGSAGGVGCTMLAVNLAVELADIVGPEERVAVVDLDFRFGHVATLLDVHGQYTISDLCSSHEELDPDVIQKALIKHESGVFVLRRPHTFAHAEMITAAHCANVLTSLQNLCAYVVTDGPTRHEPGGRSVLDAADVNLMLLQLLVTSVRNTDRMVQELGAQGFNTDRISYICNRVGRESAHLEIDQVEAILNRKMFACISDDWKNVSGSVNIGQPLKLHAERCRPRLEIRELAMRIHAPEKFSDAANRKGGLLGRLFGKPTGGGPVPVETAPQS